MYPWKGHWKIIERKKIREEKRKKQLKKVRNTTVITRGQTKKGLDHLGSEEPQKTYETFSRGKLPIDRQWQEQCSVVESGSAGLKHGQ